MARTGADVGSVGEPLGASAAPTAPPTGNGAKPPFRERFPSVVRERPRRAAKIKPSYERHYRQTIRKLDLWSVLKIAICFYTMALVVILFAGVVLWWIASAFGVISNIENFVGDLFNSTDFKFLSWNVLRASALVGLIIDCLLVVWTVLGAAFYNLFSQIFGGVEMTITEEEMVVRK
jgi:hypothetical protein